MNLLLTSFICSLEEQMHRVEGEYGHCYQQNASGEKRESQLKLLSSPCCITHITTVILCQRQSLSIAKSSSRILWMGLNSNNAPFLVSLRSWHMLLLSVSEFDARVWVRDAGWLCDTRSRQEAKSSIVPILLCTRKNIWGSQTLIKLYYNYIMVILSLLSSFKYTHRHTHSHLTRDYMWNKLHSLICSTRAPAHVWPKYLCDPHNRPKTNIYYKYTTFTTHFCIQFSGKISI